MCSPSGPLRIRNSSLRSERLVRDEVCIGLAGSEVDSDGRSRSSQAGLRDKLRPAAARLLDVVRKLEGCGRENASRSAPLSWLTLKFLAVAIRNDNHRSGSAVCDKHDFAARDVADAAQKQQTAHAHQTPWRSIRRSIHGMLSCA